MPPIFEQIGKANREIVSEGVEVLRVAYEDFIHRKQKAGVDFKFVDGQMIGHNFYKLIIYHIAGEVVDAHPGADKAEVRNQLMRIAVDTLTRALAQRVTNENDLDMN